MKIKAIYWILLIQALTYIRVLDAGFVFDDVFIVEHNALTSSWSNLWAAITGDLWSGDVTSQESSGFTRPVYVLTLFIDRLLFDNNPILLHLHSLAWGLGVTWVYWLFLSAWNVPRPSIAVAILALHPFASEYIYWLAARNDTLMLFFLFASQWAWLKKRPWWALVFALGAMGSKEVGLFVPLFWIILCWPKSRAQSGALILALVCALAFGVHILGSGGSPVLNKWVNEGELLYSIPILVVWWFARVLWPWPLSAAYPLRDLTFSQADACLAVCSLGLLLMGLRAINRSTWSHRVRFMIWAPAIAALLIAPTFLPVSLTGVFGLRYFMAPLMVLIIAVSFINIRVLRGLSVLLPVYCALIFIRGSAFVSDRAYWEHETHWLPSSYSYVSLGHIYFKTGELSQAQHAYAKGLAMADPYLYGCSNFLLATLKLQGSKSVLTNYEWTKEVGCADGVYYGLVTLALFAEGELEQAKLLAQRAPSDPSKRLNVVKSALALKGGDSSVCVSEALNWSSTELLYKQINVLISDFEESDCTMVIQ